MNNSNITYKNLGITYADNRINENSASYIAGTANVQLTTQTKTVAESYSKDASYYKSFNKSVTFSFPNKLCGVTYISPSYSHSGVKITGINGNTVSFSLYYGYISSDGSGTNTVTMKAVGY